MTCHGILFRMEKQANIRGKTNGVRMFWVNPRIKDQTQIVEGNIDRG